MKTLQVEVLKRYMTDAEVKEFIEEYRNHSKRHRFVRKPSEKDVKVANLFKKEHSYLVVSKMLNIPTSQVHASVGRVYAYKN